MEPIERDETLPIPEDVANKLDQAVSKETEELRAAAETNIIPFKSTPTKTFPDSPRPKIQKGVNKYVTSIHNEFISSIAGTKDLRLALAKSDNKRAQELLVSLLDPRKKNIATAHLVHRSGLSSLDLLDILRDHYIGSGLQEYLKGFKEIAQDTVEDAKSTNRECHKCDGEGVIEKEGEYKECALCKGTGLIRQAGDPDARKLIAQSLKLIQSGSGPSVSVSIQNNNHRSFECVIDEVERQETARRRQRQADPPIIDVTPA